MKFSFSYDINPEPGFNRDSKDLTVRPVRFPIRTSFRYRESGALAWRQGITIDISRSGVLFQAEHMIAPRTILAMRISFPSEMTGGAAASLSCCGSVVRCEAAESPSRQVILAACFFNYRFAPQ